MKIILKLLTVSLAVCIVSIATANPRVEVKRGNGAATAGQADAALLHYKKALDEKADTSVVMYNLGNVLYDQEKYKEAERAFSGSLGPEQPPVEQSETLYNLGNTLFQAKEYDKAIGAYVEALKRNSSDDEARYNLELARRMLQQQQQQQKEDQENKDQEQKPDSNKQDNQDQQDKQDEQQKQDQPQDQPGDQNQQQPQDQKQEQQQQQQPQPGQKMTKEEAERLLNALLSNEQDALKDVKKVKVASRKKREKDW